MYKVKLSIATDNQGCNRQIPHSNFKWGNYEFYINQDINETDFWIVYSKGQRKTETSKCAPENTIFITGEPETVYHYSNQFVNQFALVLSVQSKIKHPNMILCQPAQPWHIGKITKQYEGGIKDASIIKYTQTYDSLKSISPHKEKLISVITSNKAFTKGHKERIEFVQKLKSHYGDKLDLFGWGFNSFDDKWDVIAPYKYHICIENSSYPHYWTEKLADCYLGEAFPFYYGCPNINEYFAPQSYKFIDIKNVESAIHIIDNALQENLYEKNIKYIQAAKTLVLDKYNLFAMLAEQLDKMNPNMPKKQLTIKHDLAFFDSQKIKVMIWNRFKNKILK